MKKIFLILILCPLSLRAQFRVIPFIGLNTTKMTESYSGYANGGNYGIFGIEIEKQFNLKQYSPVSFSLVSGLSYLPNGFNRTSIFEISIGSGSYSYQKTNIDLQYIQIPAMARINWRPSVLVENWSVFFGAGISFNQTNYAHIAEQASEVSLTLNNSGLLPPPTLKNYQDSRDVTSIAVKNPLFQRFDFGMRFKHIQVTYRISVSMQDMYFKGIENTWQVPAADSFYISAHNSRGITKEKYSEIVFGWRF
jgi:hypothetical protein